MSGNKLKLKTSILEIKLKNGVCLFVEKKSRVVSGKPYFEKEISAYLARVFEKIIEENEIDVSNIERFSYNKLEYEFGGGDVLEIKAFDPKINTKSGHVYLLKKNLA